MSKLKTAIKWNDPPLPDQDRVNADKHREAAYRSLCEIFGLYPDQEFPKFRELVNNLVSCAVLESTIYIKQKYRQNDN